VWEGGVLSHPETGSPQGGSATSAQVVYETSTSILIDVAA
jgi:hypothetical protein